MKNVSFFVSELDNLEYAIIEHADGSFTSMPKAVYEAQQVEHLTEIPTPDEA